MNKQTIKKIGIFLSENQKGVAEGYMKLNALVMFSDDEASIDTLNEILLVPVDITKQEVETLIIDKLNEGYNIDLISGIEFVDYSQYIQYVIYMKDIVEEEDNNILSSKSVKYIQVLIMIDKTMLTLFDVPYTEDSDDDYFVKRFINNLLKNKKSIFATPNK